MWRCYKQNTSRSTQFSLQWFILSYYYYVSPVGTYIHFWTEFQKYKFFLRVSLHNKEGAERASANVSGTLRSSKGLRGKLPSITHSTLMDIQQSWGYYWKQGDFCRAIFSLLFTGIFSYLVHPVEWGDETSLRGIHKWLQWKIGTEVAEIKKEAGKLTKEFAT